MKVLIVEDDSQMSIYIQKMLEKWGYQVENAETGKEALAKAKNETFDLILLDIFLPDIEGYQLIPPLKEQSPDVNIITMTGANSRELESKIRGMGILYYMIKPFEINNLKFIMEHITKRNLQNQRGD